jgi:hypothetical protein
VSLSTRAKAVAHELHGLVERNRSEAGPDHDALVVSDEIVDVQVHIVAPRRSRAGSRGIAQQVG